MYTGNCWADGTRTASRGLISTHPASVHTSMVLCSPETSTSPSAFMKILKAVPRIPTTAVGVITW
jgi:hypothetical protein